MISAGNSTLTLIDPLEQPGTTRVTCFIDRDPSTGLMAADRLIETAVTRPRNTSFVHPVRGEPGAVGEPGLIRMATTFSYCAVSNVAVYLFDKCVNVNIPLTHVMSIGMRLL